MPLPDKCDESGNWLKNYTVSGKSRKTRAGQLWLNLETRTTNQQHKDACYEGVVNGFKSFNQFANWCNQEENYNSLDENGKVWQLDKDILKPDCKVYSPETCVFVPGKLNSIFIVQKTNGLPAGVRYYPENGPSYYAHGRTFDGKKIHIGTFATPEKAHAAYMDHKRSTIREALEYYDLPEKL